MISELEQKLLGIMIAVIMLGMGSGLTLRDFWRALRRPQGMFVGLLCQFCLMPTIAFFLAKTLSLPPLAAVGILIMGSVPGGTTSNIFSYFSKCNLALSILMTVNSTVFAIILTPLALGFYGSFFNSEVVQIPFSNISQTLAILLAPVILGMWIRKWNANVGAVLEMLGAILGVLVILLLVILWVPRNFQLLMSTPANIYISSIGLGLVGFLLGYYLGRLLKQDKRNARTIALETGIQNGPLAIAIIFLSFSVEVRDEVVLIPVLYSLFIVINSTVATIFFRKWNNQLEQKMAELL